MDQCCIHYMGFLFQSAHVPSSKVLPVLPSLLPRPLDLLHTHIIHFALSIFMSMSQVGVELVGKILISQNQMDTDVYYINVESC